MKVVYKEDSIQHENSKNCIANEYNTNDSDINIACVKVNGRYPINGKIANKVCKEIVYVSEGIGTLYLEEKIISLKAGDVVLIEPNEKYYWKGIFTLIPACYPAWDFKQVEFFK
jgi:mannose-6-phosphate isomerase-like protein (cupin superfamily)